MAATEELIRAKLGILALVGELKNVTRACKLLGISRSQFYAMKSAYKANGREGLAPKIRRKPQMRNRTPLLVENHILLKTLEYHNYSYLAFAAKMRSEGVSVTPSMVRYVWKRHGLSTAQARIKWARRSRLSPDDPTPKLHQERLG